MRHWFAILRGCDVSPTAYRVCDNIHGFQIVVKDAITIKAIPSLKANDDSLGSAYVIMSSGKLIKPFQIFERLIAARLVIRLLYEVA